MEKDKRFMRNKKPIKKRHRRDLLTGRGRMGEVKYVLAHLQPNGCKCIHINRIICDVIKAGRVRKIRCLKR